MQIRKTQPGRGGLFRQVGLLVAMFVALLALSPSHAKAEGTVKLGTLDWEPYIGKALPNNGFVATLVREAFQASGYTVEFDFLPWIRAKTNARMAKIDGCVPEYYLEEDQADFLISDPFPGGPLGFMKRKADSITFTTLEDLKNYKIGVVHGYVNTEAFDKADFLSKEEANSDIINLKKLVGGRVDLVVIDKFVGISLMQNELPQQSDQVDFVSPPLEEKTLHVLISKKTPDAEAKMEAFNAGLKALKESGRVESLMKENGF